MMKFAPEGYPFFAGFLTAALAAAIFLPWASAILFLLFLFMLWFFRDPERTVPSGKNLFVAPADGRVILVRDAVETEFLGKEMKEISIFMSPLNVHVNRAPCEGRVKLVKHFTGKFLAAYREEASLKNEHISLVMETVHGDILVRQVAGFVARRAVCRKKEGDVLGRGERYGIIKFSSRLDIYLPKDAQIRVTIGETVRAGETILGTADDIQEKRPG